MKVEIISFTNLFRIKSVVNQMGSKMTCLSSKEPFSTLFRYSNCLSRRRINYKLFIVFTCFSFFNKSTINNAISERKHCD